MWQSLIDEILSDFEESSQKSLAADVEDAAGLNPGQDAEGVASGAALSPRFVRAWEKIARASRKQGLQAEHRVWLIHRDLCSDAVGRCSVEALRSRLTELASAKGVKHPERSAGRMLDQYFTSGFCHMVGDAVAFRSPEKVARLLGCQVGSFVRIPLTYLELTPAQLVHVIHLAHRQGLETSRAASPVAKRTQVKAEAKVGAIRVPTYYRVGKDRASLAPGVRKVHRYRHGLKIAVNGSTRMAFPSNEGLLTRGADTIYLDASATGTTGPWKPGRAGLAGATGGAAAWKAERTFVKAAVVNKRCVTIWDLV